MTDDHMTSRTIEQVVTRLNNTYSDELGDDFEIVHRITGEFPNGEASHRIRVKPTKDRSVEQQFESDIGEAFTEDELQAFMRGLELAGFNEIENKAQAP